MKTPKHKTREYHLVSTISCFQAMLAEGPPSWERDRNARCEREIRKASAELVELMVTKHRKAVKLLDKRCARYTSEWQARQGRNSATTEITSREATPPKP